VARDDGSIIELDAKIEVSPQLTISVEHGAKLVIYGEVATINNPSNTQGSGHLFEGTGHLLEDTNHKSSMNYSTIIARGYDKSSGTAACVKLKEAGIVGPGVKLDVSEGAKFVVEGQLMAGILRFLIGEEVM
jgi:hypothetical protein